MSLSLAEFPSQLQAVLAVLNTNLRSIEKHLAVDGAEFNKELADASNKLAAAYVGVSREASRWIAQLKKNASQASLQERISGVQGFILGLSLGDRTDLYKMLAQAESERSGDAVSLTVAEPS